jgi:amino acid transporter
MKIKLEKISTLALVLLITGAIDSIRNLPTTALFGSELIFFFLLSAVVFLIPVALIAAELSSAWSEEEGGIYDWIKLAFGKHIAFLGIWLQWINTLVWYPTILSFIAGTFSYLINPSLAENKAYLISVILSTFWILTLLNLKGLKTSARFAGICAITGMIIPMGFIILLAIAWLFMGEPIQIHFTAHNMLPNLTHPESWISLTAIMTAFLGMELAAVHVKQVKDPKTNFPKAMFFSVLLILFTMIFGSLAIAFVLPKQHIHLVDGVMQAFQHFLSAYHLSFLMPILIIMLLVGSLGGMINWIISPTKGMLIAAEDGFLPPYFAKRNRHNVPHRLLLAQAVFVSLLGGAFLLLPSVNTIYWLFTDLSTELYMMMYVLMFISAIQIKRRYPDKKRDFSVPGGKIGYYVTCLLGLIGSSVTIVVGFFSPGESIGAGGDINYTFIFSMGIICMLLPSALCYVYKKMYGNV